MSLAYYPGCTLKTRARNLEEPAVASMETLGFKLNEVPRWNCCGEVAPVRNLIRAKKQGETELVTLCAFCLNTLKRANVLMKEDAAKRDTINDFIDEGIDYAGEVKVIHLLEVLRDDLGWETLSQKVRLPLKGLKAAPYYGCTLLRPREVTIDCVDDPTILREFLEALGASPVDFPESQRCCGSYQVISSPDDISEYARPILDSALSCGTETLVLTCPLCDYNLGRGQKELSEKSGFREMPLLYFTQLLAIALGIDRQVCHFELNHGSPELLLKGKNLIS
jgi:heterodisulfide reductase subunit B